MDNQKAEGVRDYGTNCLDCERYKRVGEVCVLEHGKRHLSDFCRDFEAKVELPDYNELMKSVRQDMATQRQKEREKKERERKQKQKEREAKKEEKRRMRISRGRKRYLKEQKNKEKLREKRKVERQKKKEPQAVEVVSSNQSKEEAAPGAQRNRSRKEPTIKACIPFAQSSFVSDDEPVKKERKKSEKRKTHSSKTPKTASSASATA